MVGTPGRILDLFSRGDFSGSAVEILVLDEADELLQNETFRYIIRKFFIALHFVICQKMQLYQCFYRHFTNWKFELKRLIH